MRFMLILFAVLLPLGIAASSNRKNSLEDGVLLIALLAGMGWFMRLGLASDAQRLAQIPAIEANQDPGEGKEPKPDATALAELERVNLLPRPRTIRLNASSRTALMVMRIIPIGMWLWGIHDLFSPRQPIGLAEQTPLQARVYAAGLCVLGVIVWFLLNKSFERKTNFEMLRHGEVALARITRAVSRKAVSPVLEYAFSDPNGSLSRGQVEDVGGIHNEGEYLLVLYDRKSPEKSLPLCATNYEFPKF